MISLTYPLPTPLHGFRAGPKLLALMGLTAVVLVMDRAGPLALMLLAVGTAYASGGRAFTIAGVRVLRPLWPLIVVVCLWHLWLGAPREGLVMALRLTVAMAAANLVTMTTRLDALIAVLTRVTFPLRHIGIPPHALALAVALTLRTVPVLALRYARAGDAWRARSPRRAGWRTVNPTLLAVLDESEHVADALRARGGLS
ncbi:energy-coupling factor transporter transmembrane component T [Falsirhodobacter sp. alg1]|uniref:energy-coupling factor transporter transmembrane component T n=1 Tax=Falsirhodobacter sp. alg1 TaxID=1472418 RepID=UPI000787EF56|nr:energy-coupling factor transporter transmembrane component T [Falsirhodobacter sp. alg1]